MKPLIFVLVVLLIVLHHDFWFWDNTNLVLGFLPVGMAYHIFISLAAATLWYVATLTAWPDDLEEESKPSS